MFVVTTRQEIKKRCANWLHKKFIEFEHKAGARRTQKEFSAWLGVDEALLSLWMSARRAPDGISARKIAYRLGMEIFDIIEIPPPPKALIDAEVEWANFTDRFHQEFARVLNDARADYESERGDEKGHDGELSKSRKNAS